MTEYIHNPDNLQMMDELYVALSEDNGGEGIVAMMTPSGHAPFVFGHKYMVDKTKHYLELIHKKTKKKITIYRFTKAEIIDTIE